MREGGFPEAISLGRRIIPSIYNDILIKDVVSRYKVRDVTKFKEFANAVVKYFSSEVSIRKLSYNLGVSTATVEEWLRYIQESYLIYPIKRYSRSPRNFNTYRKVYVVDPGIINYLSPFSYGGIMENAVAIHLLRKNQLDGVYYVRGEDYEVDFFDEKEGELIQVSYFSSLDELNKNEITSLIKGSEALGISKLKIISWDLDDEINVEGKKVKILPLWKYLI
ncbi:DUF4143 domain-containing protein [Acidianus sp. HS-5]|uniref:ATP-binding protein n=1 Tax=Acidianus sp. HS-5 TaxID=2886040 RepID=UPI001F3EA3AC|nr:DUF4143 domain-containing protein [Acidianus sp. HS-5]BDC17898.1 hypothetical protein HS5_07880 [Acidianus sp. HS-5]